MVYNYPEAGEGYATAYMMSATPFVTSSQVSLGEIKQIEFGRVARFFYVKNNGPSSNVISVAFTRNGFLPQNSNYFFLSGSESFDSELRVTSLFISGSAGSSTAFTVIGGLTSIPEKNFNTITGSNGHLGVG